ncbi:MAG: hypothetical protein ABH824_07345 [Nanoarchaeota archaeon]|nr:hypothetical protein [Nanoarchaeota archaeon]MBU1632013.1 hypothetical protein [Nanoarchaeota archaeon]MBU1875628.1 hypothetical protein [Nanoarchaeota archaeon]
MAVLSILCQLNGGCMGCCGHDFMSKDKINEAIKRNTSEFKRFNPKSEMDFLKFRDRYYSYNLLNGVCRNLVEDNGLIFCPLHPSRHKGKDLRIDHCEINHLCKTAEEFNKWADQKQEKFILFIKEKDFDNIGYSIKMDDDSLLKEFENS